MTPQDAERRFVDPALRAAAVETGPVFAAMYARLNAISQDIKNLERHLLETPVRKVVTVQVLDAGALLWTLGEPDAWRIVYLDRKDETMKPLLECPVEVRIRAQPFLPALLRAVSEAAQG